MDICAVVLAAAESGQMRSKQATLVHHLAGKPLITWVRDSLKEAGASDQIYVVGRFQEQIREEVGEEVAYVFQETQLGSGHAVFQASTFLESRQGLTLVVHGDTPLVSPKTLKRCIEKMVQGHHQALVVTSVAQDPRGYGRVVRDAEGKIVSIIEDKDCTEEEKAIGEVNAGVYCFDTALLLSTIGRLGSYMCLEGMEDIPKRFHFTDTIDALLREKHSVTTLQVPFEEIMSVRNRLTLEQARVHMSHRICQGHMARGVTILDPLSTRIDADVVIGPDTELAPGCSLRGQTQIGSDVTITQGTSLQDAVVGDRCHIEHSVIRQSVLEADCRIGPFTHIWEGCYLGRKTQVASFSDLRQVETGCDVHISPSVILAFATIGEGASLGSQTSVVDHDEQHQYRAVVGEHAFVGSHVSLIAPVTVAPYAFIACGTVVAQDVPAYALAIGRSVQENKPDWVRRRLGKLQGQRKATSTAQEAQLEVE